MDQPSAQGSSASEREHFIPVRKIDVIDALMTHGGKEYGYVSSGTLGVRVGFDEYELGPGDSIAFHSTSPHRLWTIGDEPAHALWVVIGRKADPRGSE